MGVEGNSTRSASPTDTYGCEPLARRSKLEIYLDVLWTIKNGDTKPTRIMYGANLSWKPLQRILKSMISQGLIEEISPERIKDKRTTNYYEITQKGENIIKYFNRAKEFLELEEVTKTR
jgi:predicted transcriptional regulator